jgi:GDPmannose 4,6-dehydratase
MVQTYRDAYGIYGCNGILYPHESPRRRPMFVTRKISIAVARIKLGKQNDVVLGNLEARRDWGFAPDYVVAMHRMLQQPTPDNYVVATGKLHSVAEFAQEAFQVVGLKSDNYVRLSSDYQRPLDHNSLVGDPTKAQMKLDWTALIDFDALVRTMVLADLDRELAGTG